MDFTLSAERRQAILTFAKASYISDCLYHDPGLTKGIDNLLLLLLRLVVQVSEERACVTDNIGLHAGDRLRALLCGHTKLPRSVRRWMSDHEVLFIDLAEHMAAVLNKEDMPEVPPFPVHGIPKHVQVEGPSEVQLFLTVAAPDGSDVKVPIGRGQYIGSWKVVGFTELPLPDWWHGQNRRRPPRAAVYLDGVAHGILTKDAD